MRFRVSSVQEQGVGLNRVNVSLVTADAPPTTGIPYGAGQSSINLNLSVEEATDYFPGKFFNVEITPEEA